MSKNITPIIYEIKRDSKIDRLNRFKVIDNKESVNIKHIISPYKGHINAV